jgi:hypothetical protein
MNKHANDVYHHSVNYLNKKGNIKINHNILEYVCKYHHCVDHQFNHRHELYEELKQYFNLTTTGIILQLISALKKGNEGKTFTEYSVYLDALRYAEDQCLTDLIMAE